MRALLIPLVLVISNAALADDARYVEAQNKVKYILKDPDSAQFREMRDATNLDAVPAICGELNSKNSYGGYTGFSPFSVSNAGVFLYERGSPPGYALSGCGGRKKEIIERADLEARFQCGVLEQMTRDLQAKTPQEQVLATALDSVQKHAIELGRPIAPAALEPVRQGYEQFIAATASDISARRRIDPANSKIQCYLDTSKQVRAMLEAQYPVAVPPPAIQDSPAP